MPSYRDHLLQPPCLKTRLKFSKKFHRREPSISVGNYSIWSNGNILLSWNKNNWSLVRYETGEPQLSKNNGRSLNLESMSFETCCAAKCFVRFVGCNVFWMNVSKHLLYQDFTRQYLITDSHCILFDRNYRFAGQCSARSEMNDTSTCVTKTRASFSWVLAYPSSGKPQIPLISPNGGLISTECGKWISFYFENEL